MSGNDFFALLPLLVLAGSSVLIMLLIAIRLSHRIIQRSSSFLFLIAFLSIFYIQKVFPYSLEPLLIVDGFSAFIMGLIIFSSIVVNILSYIYFEEKEESPKEYYVLLFLCTLGACVMAVSKHFVSLFLGLEILTVGLYALMAYLRGRNKSIEAGIKYLVLAAFSSAFLLFGMALIYLETGSMEFTQIAKNLDTIQIPSTLFITGLGMMLVGVGFKLAVVPFHMWAADVYQGAPVPITAFIATASKAGVFAVPLRFFNEIDAFRYNQVLWTVTFITIATLIVGNLLALQQKNVKRILAYSSIAHLGYLLVAFIPGNTLSLYAVSFYLLAYFICTLTAFGVITLLSNKVGDAEDIDTYKALFWQNPLLAFIFSVSLISLAGIPLTAGFIGKFYILLAALQSGFWLIALILVITSVFGLYYYLRIITVMFSGNKIKVAKDVNPNPIFYATSLITLFILTLLTIGIGVFPAGIMRLIEHLIR